MKYILALCVLAILTVCSYNAASKSFRPEPESANSPDSTYSGDAELSAQREIILKYENYYADDAIVQITALDNKHIAGTFSGKFISDHKKTIQITNGSFDVPYKGR